MNSLTRVAVGFIACAFAAPAFAADLPMPVKAPPLAAPYNWSGFYAGANAGYGWDPASASFNPGAFATTILEPLTGGTYVVTGSSGPVNLSVNPQGVLGGIQTGYNWQSGATVYGIEADFDGSAIRGSTAAPFFVNGTIGGDLADFTGNVGLTQKVDYFGTVRGRLGWATNNVLLYGTGGFAWGHVTTTFNTSNITEAMAGQFTPAQLAALQVSASSSSLRAGFAVGAGVEWALLRNWSIRGEYLFVDLVGSGALAIPGGSASFSYLPIQVVHFGFNYQFH